MTLLKKKSRQCIPIIQWQACLVGRPRLRSQQIQRCSKNAAFSIPFQWDPFMIELIFRRRFVLSDVEPSSTFRLLQSASCCGCHHMFGQSDTNASQRITRVIIAQWVLLSYLCELHNHPRVRFGVNTALVFRRLLKTNAIQGNTVALVLFWGLHSLALKGGTFKQ